MSYHAPDAGYFPCGTVRRRQRALGQALTRAQINAALPRTGIAGSGITPEMVMLGGGVIGFFALMVLYYRAKGRLWEAAIPDADARFAARFVTGL